MKKIVVTSLVLLLVFACKTKETKKVDSEEPETVAPPQPVPTLEVGCYTYEANGNKVVLEITEINNAVLGNLSYALSEKDANAGTFAGELLDSVLIGKYTFMSEGTQGNTREVAFLFKDGQLIEGYGELDEIGTAFKDKNALSFSSSMPLSKTDCEP
ncbi:hypothetical protein [Flagellimonas pelagia]|uniref:Uncharacterized protein n=1 Tax=Flagellimonas pelagia TaxID=2306998 RepID=A0A3A1NFU0_9FLAO|nr:hypothetical protein [Allomuricauda maritima]RIV43968.1 hypothetical protein D2V05_10750 [Allomuricauda maritima]TXJ93873.1 hypothetical protein FQ017_10640 [Allomuricauda maritima]